MKQELTHWSFTMEKIKKSTIVRIIILIVALLNQSVAVIGASTFANNDWYQIFSVIVTIITAIINTWYNNDITRLARIAGVFFEALKDGKISEDEAQKILGDIQNE